ncbi:hypothetical protein PHJA_000586100 [Phtheirospermum japonicum]|uniref:Uncharacterized protein n=1 Tax=Phtheirospermum japonicum TaxID=374723 RepID=A0A830BK73_9LAMI|nr:hypothetical protein PHJA_000586100 [Phtheirospermum japonicum]
MFRHIPNETTTGESVNPQLCLKSSGRPSAQPPQTPPHSARRLPPIRRRFALAGPPPLRLLFLSLPFLLPTLLPPSRPTIPRPLPTSSAAFLHLRTAAGPTTLFLVSSPVPRPSATLLRFYILRDDRFSRARVVSNHRDLELDQARCGVVFRVDHGVSMKLSAGINVFTLLSVSSCKIWVFAVRLIADGEALKLMKCAVIDCCSPVYTIRLLFGFLILGEENGVRVFPLQPLVKGNHRKEKKSSGTRINNHHGVGVTKASNGGGKTVATDGDSKHSEPVKLRSVKLRQDSKDVGAFFVAFEDSKDVESSLSMKMTRRSVKAIFIQALSANCFVVLDSVGDVHLLSLSYSAQGLDNRCLMKRLTFTMKVVKLAVFEDVSTATQTVWISDGYHSVHLMIVSGMDNSFDKTEKIDTKEKLIQTSVTQAIFASEKIQEIVPLAANAILILGQDSALFAGSMPLIHPTVLSVREHWAFEVRIMKMRFDTGIGGI